MSQNVSEFNNIQEKSSQNFLPCDRGVTNEIYNM